MKKRKHNLVFLAVILLCVGMLVGCAKKEAILNIDPDTVQSIELYMYDTQKNETVYGWCYQEEDMAELLSYLSKVSGEEVEEFSLTEWPERFWGIMLNVGPANPKLLIVEDYLITAEGRCYRIDGEAAEDICETMHVEESRKSEGIPYVLNRRYAAQQNGAFRPAFLYEAERDIPLLADVVMETSEESYGTDKSKIDFTIFNQSEQQLAYGSQVFFEVLIEDVWYSMDDMLAENVNIGWTSELRMQAPGSTVEDGFYISCYQPLLPGTYRLVKEFTIGEETGYAACEFRIE